MTISMMLRDDCGPYGFDRRRNWRLMQHRKEPPFIASFYRG